MTWSNVETPTTQLVNPAGQTGDSIPWVDMGRFLSGCAEEKMAIAIEFGRAFQELGFVAVSNIGICQKNIDAAFQYAEKFFTSSDEFKLNVKSIDGHYGFIPFGTEHARYTDVRDLKEFYQTTGPTQPIHMWPDITGFKAAMTELYLDLEACMKNCLQATAIYLGYTQDQNVLSHLLGNGNALLRLLHYPPIDHKQMQPGAVRAAPHEDVSLMTINPRATQSGLQVQNHRGQWIGVNVPENAAIVNAGDALSYITNGIIPSTTHRVINPEEHDDSHRYSFPFFGSMPFNTVLNVLDKCGGMTPKPKSPNEITFGDFLTKRYRAIGLTK